MFLYIWRVSNFNIWFSELVRDQSNWSHSTQTWNLPKKAFHISKKVQHTHRRTEYRLNHRTFTELNVKEFPPKFLSEQSKTVGKQSDSLQMHFAQIWSLLLKQTFKIFLRPLFIRQITNVNKILFTVFQCFNRFLKVIVPIEWTVVTINVDLFSFLRLNHKIHYKSK